MTITFEFEQDFRKYREYVTYVTKIDEAIGKLPLLFFQGSALTCFIVERKGDILNVLLTNNTDELVANFTKEAQPSTFETIPEGVAYLYDLTRHELIYNFDAKETSSTWNWSTYPETIWMSEADKYDHGLAIGDDGKLCRLYLSNRRLLSLFLGLQEIEISFPDMLGKDKTKATNPQTAGVEAVLSIYASQFGQDEPRIGDVRTAIACNLVKTSNLEYAKYDFKEVIKLFELVGNEDDLWEDTWGVDMDNAMARDEGIPRLLAPATMGSMFPSNNLVSDLDAGTFQLCLSEMAGLDEVPQTDRPIYVHMDVPIHGIHYMMIEPDQTLAIFFDDLIIGEAAILQHLENLPEEQISLHGDYDPVDSLAESEYNTFQTKFDESTKSLSDSDEELGTSGG